MTIGDKIKQLRKERGMTQEELGNLIGVQKAAINKYETGIVVNLKKEIIAKLAKALDVNPVWLMDDEDDWPPVPSTKTLIARAFLEDQQAKMLGEESPKTPESRLLAKGMDKMPEALRKAIMTTLEYQYPTFFTEGNENDDT